MRNLWRFRVGFIFLFCVVLFVGCAPSSKETSLVASEKPKEIHDRFLYFDRDIEGDWKTYGDLYLKTVGEDSVEKIASDVVDYSYTYNSAQDRVYFQDHDENLYTYKPGHEPVKLAEDVSIYEDGNEHVFVMYRNNDSELYIITSDLENEKITSSPRNYYARDKELYYVTEEGNLKQYNVETRTLQDLASSVKEVLGFLDNDDFFYTNDEDLLYMWNRKEAESRRVSSGTIVTSEFKIYPDQVAYVVEDGANTYSLFQMMLDKDMEITKIAEGVQSFDFNKNRYYYIDDESDLYVKTAGEREATKLASEALEIRVKDDQMYHYLGTDMEMYKGRGQEWPEKSSLELESHRFTAKGDVIVLNEPSVISEGSLMLNSEEIAENVNKFGLYFDNLAYATNDGKLYLMKDLKKPQLVDEDVSDYTSVDYYGQTVYLHMLNYSDIAGVWHWEEYDDYVKIHEDGTVEDLGTGYRTKLEIIHSQTDMLQLELDGEEIEIRPIGDDILHLQYLNAFDSDYIDSDSLSLTRVSEEEAKEALKE